MYSYAQSTVGLKEVIVKPNTEKVLIGTKQRKADYGIGGSKDFPFFQTAYFIPSNGVTGFVDRVGLYIYHKHSFLEFAKPAKELLLYLYLPDSAGMPGALFVPEPIHIKPKKNTYWHWVDLSEYSLNLPAQGVFAAVGWVKPSKNDAGPLVGMSNECSDCPFYIYRFMTEDSAWHKIDTNKVPVTDKKNAFRNGLMVRLEVAVEAK
ncbi:hypothetical protein GCM10028895_41180 [Pontibacter rugosus]